MSSPDVPEWLGPVKATSDIIEAEMLAPKFPHPPKDARPAAVLVLFADGPQGRELLLTERASTMRSHAGQISFPGGRSDPGDADAADTALREADEEVGLERQSVSVFADLPRLWIPPSNHAVTPVLAYWHEPKRLAPASPDEVSRVLHVPIDELLDPNRRFTATHPAGFRGPAFDIGTSVPLWGFTAGIISRLFHHVGWEIPWDEERTISIEDFA